MAGCGIFARNVESYIQSPVFFCTNCGILYSVTRFFYTNCGTLYSITRFFCTNCGILYSMTKENVFILGELHYNDIPRFYSSIDLCIQPSVSEGSLITLKEAMASSLPILASITGGTPEIIK